MTDAREAICFVCWNNNNTNAQNKARKKMARKEKRKRYEKTGRPEQWTRERLEQLGESVLEYAKKPDSMHILGWRANEMLTRGQVSHCQERSEFFADSYELAKQIIGARRCGLALNGDISERIYLKEQWNYDEDQRCREDEKDKRKVEQQINLLAQLQATEELVNQKDASSNIPLEDQD